MPNWTIGGYPIGIGWLIALLVLIAAFVIWLADSALTRDKVLAMIAALALARLIP